MANSTKAGCPHGITYSNPHFWAYPIPKDSFCREGTIIWMTTFRRVFGKPENKMQG